VEARGYKNIMNLPDFQNNGYPTINQEMQAGSAWKFLPPAGFFILSFHPVISGSVAMDPINPMIRGIPIPGISKPAERVEGKSSGGWSCDELRAYSPVWAGHFIRLSAVMP
jgi:hypothetical protein